MSNVTVSQMANAVRALSMDAVQKANSGHPGMPLGMADVATVLFSKFLTVNPQDPDWVNRDRFILSAGHGSMLLYALLYLTGYSDITIEDIKNFRQFGSKTAGHPEYGYIPGIETTTGPLGQGIANAVGFALAERLLANRHGEELIDHYTYAIVGDGCLMEGISHEAISMAGHLSLGKLVVLFDDNQISIDGPTDLAVSDDQLKRFEASGWDVCRIDGHDPEAIEKAIAAAKETSTPSLIACRTTIGYGAPNKAGTSGSHGAPLGEDEIAGTRKNLGWDAAPFEIPETILAAWRDAGARNENVYQEWQSIYANYDQKALFDRVVAGKLPTELSKAIAEYKQTLTNEAPGWATRKSSGEVLSQLESVLPELLGGSADLTGSNLTRAKAMTPINRDDFSGNYVFYGVREHAMAAVMNGIALHGGFIPYGGTFLVFTDYCKPSIRLSALMKQRVIYVMTHDSIGLGEDGPTHQPIEHLASLRSIPNTYVFRPADAIETLESWQSALELENAPSVLALTRQGVPLVRREYTEENLCHKGAYILSESNADRADVSIFATGSEVQLALEAQAILQEQHGVSVRVVSVPCTRLFEEQDSDYQDSILEHSELNVAVEAAIRQGWDQFIGRKGIFVGMNGFGASAPADQLYEHFNITTDYIVKSVNQRLGK